MGTPTITFPKLLDKLQRSYGSPAPPHLSDPLELVIWENIAYLANDERRAEAFTSLKRNIGTRPSRFSLPSAARSLRSPRPAYFPDLSSEKLLTIARIAYEEFGSDLRSVLKKPLPQAKKALKKFPGIGRSGCREDTLVYPLLSVDGTRFERVASVVPSGFCQGAIQLFHNVSRGSGRDSPATPQGLRFPDPSPPVASPARSENMQTVDAALCRMSS